MGSDRRGGGAGERSAAAHTRRHSASASLLEGKYEAVYPTASPTADKFRNELGQQQSKDKEKDGFSLFRPRSRSTASPQTDNAKSPSLKPHLELNLTVAKEPKSRALGVVFEAADDRGNLPETVIGDRRLTPSETLSLVKACAAAIVDRGGLETLGVMHPHWYSASPDVQRRLISLFILSLAPSSSETTLSPTPDSPSRIFDSELTYTRSPHDIAAVLRWALRHLRIEGSSFASTSEGDELWRWYTSFSEAERSANYPTNAFSQSLAPALPPSHLQLLTATLDIISSLAAHAETNGSSGSKLTKFLGLWLLTAQRAVENDDWTAFYTRWERAGRILEHAFLSYVRDEAEKKKIPLRLAELVKHFPYTVSQDQLEDGLLPRPRFSTRRYDALFVRVSTELPTVTTPKPKQHPLRFIAQAFNAEVVATGDLAELWEKLKQAASSGSEDASGSDSHVFSRIFDDDTLRILSLIPTGPDSANKSITLSTPTPREGRPTRRRSTSLGPGSKPNGNHKGVNGKTHSIALPTPASVPLPASPTDWADFSTTGFGELSKDLASTLLDDDDVEVTVPTHAQPKRKSSSRKRKSTSSPPTSRRSSVDNPRPHSQRSPVENSPVDAAKTQTSLISLIKLDEAFIDFWSDALTDPAVTSNWPTFVLCQFKTNVPVTIPGPEGKPVNWLVIEHAFTYPPPPPPAPVPEPTSPTSPTSSKRPSSPRPSVRSNISSRKSSTFSGRRSFNFFTGGSGNAEKTAAGSSTTKTGFSLKSPNSRKRAAKASRVGEMGEVLPEIEESPKPAESENALGLASVKDKAEPATAVVASPTMSEAPKQDAPAIESKTLLATVPEVEQKEESASVEAATAPQTELTIGSTAPFEDAHVSEETVVPDEPSVPHVADTDATAAPAAETATVQSTPPGLSPVPVVDAAPTPVPDAPAPVSVEPVALEDASEEKPLISHPEAVPVDTPEVAADNVETLPPAPEPVVLSGSTPGPQLALDTSEPAVLAEAAAPEAEAKVQDTPQSEPQEPASVAAAVSGPESINIESNAVKQEEEQDPAPLAASTVEDVDQVEDTTTSTPVTPEIPLEAPTAVEETVKDEVTAEPSAVEPQQDISEVSPAPATDDTAVSNAPEEPVEEEHDPAVAPAEEEPVVEAEAQVEATTAAPLPDSEPVVEEKPTLSETAEVPNVDAEPAEESVTEASPRAEVDPAPLSAPAEVHLEPAVLSSPAAEPEASVAPVVPDIEPTAPVDEPTSQDDPVGSEAENAAEETSAPDVAVQPTTDDIAAPPTSGDTVLADSEPAEGVSSGAKPSSDGSEDVDAPASQSIDVAPEVSSTPAGPAVEDEDTSMEAAAAPAAETKEEEEKP